MELNVLYISVLSAVAYSMVVYVKKSSGNPTELDFTKMLSTILVGAAIGVLAYIRGIEVNEEYIFQQIALFAGVVVFVENALKTLYRGISSMLKRE